MLFAKILFGAELFPDQYTFLCLVMAWMINYYDISYVGAAVAIAHDLWNFGCEVPLMLICADLGSIIFRSN